MNQSPQAPPQFTYEPLHGGSPIGGAFFFFIGLIGVVLETILFGFGIGTLSETSKAGEIIFLFYSFCFMLLGGIILFYKKRYIFNRQTGYMTPLVRLPFLTLQKKKIPYANIDAVQISRKVTGKGKNVGLIFTVSLVQDDRPDIPLETFHRYPNAKRVAELLSIALDRPFQDNSSGRMVIRQPRELFPLIQQRLMSNTDIRDEPLKPKDMDAAVSESLGKMQIYIPPFGILDSLFTLLIPAFLLFLFFSWISYAFLRTLPFEIIAYSLTIPVVFILVSCSYLFRLEYIDLDNHELTLYWDFSGFKSSQTIAIKDLEGLFVIGKDDEDDRMEFLKALTKKETYGRQKDVLYPFRCLSSAIVARSAGQSVTFGRALDIEELVYLVYLIETFIRDGTLQAAAAPQH